MSEKGTEAGSPLRKKKAQEQGDGVRSRELQSAAAMLAGICTLGLVSRNFVSLWAMSYSQCIRAAATAAAGDQPPWVSLTHRVLAQLILPIGAVMMASFIAALVTGLVQGGGLAIHPGALAPKFGKLNPIANLGNIFSLRGATRVAKSLLPAAAMVVTGALAVKSLMGPMPVLSMARLPIALQLSYRLALDAAWLTLAWSALDYAVEWVSWNKRMRMTKQQVRDEVKEAMGNPQVKGRIRQVQNAMRRRKVKADISRASVVITNPTHYAVALEFSFETMQAPKVLAKGRDLHAAEIREAARWAGVPLIENPPLARSLYRMVEPGQAIPFELYAAVAGILAYLYKQKMEDKIRDERGRSAGRR